MKAHAKAQIFADIVQNLEGFVLVRKTHNYRHMGATIADAILQAGVKYDTVVRPKIKNIREIYSEAVTTSAFYRLLQEKGPKTVLSWRDDEKPNRVVALTEFFLSEGIETEEKLREWISSDLNRARLLKVRGVGPKTADYIKILVGEQAVAVDRYVFRLFEEIGFSASSYEEAIDILNIAADILNIERTVLDNSIWEYMSNRNKFNSTNLACANRRRKTRT